MKAGEWRVWCTWILTYALSRYGTGAQPVVMLLGCVPRRASTAARLPLSKSKSREFSSLSSFFNQTCGILQYKAKYHLICFFFCSRQSPLPTAVRLPQPPCQRHPTFDTWLWETDGMIPPEPHWR